MANNTIKTALLSYGMSGVVFHGPLLSVHPGFEIAAVWQRQKRELPHPVVTDMNDILNDPSIELVIVNTPNETHYEYCARVIKAGKHVVVEKPLTVTSSEADHLISLAKEHGVLLSVFQNRRWDADFLTVRKVLDEGLVGRLVECEIHYDRYRNFIEANTWKEVAKPGTGILYNLGSHTLDQAVVLFGMPKWVDARVGIQRTGGEVDDFFDIRLEYDGFYCIVKSSYLVREPGPKYILHGTNGSFLKWGIDPQEQALKDGKLPGSDSWGVESKEWWGKLTTTVDGKDIAGPYESVPGNYLLFYENIFGALREGKPLAVTPEQARDVIRLIEACFQSSKERRAIRM